MDGYGGDQMKCITHDCSNHSHQGLGRVICVEPDNDGWICEPCWTFLTEATGRLNTIYLNAKRVAEERRAERENWYAGQAGAQSIEEEAVIQDHMAENGISRLSYGDFIRSKGMDGVREGRLEFDNFTLNEKVILRTNGVMIYHGDTYERDACRCANFACEERWHKPNRPIGWDRASAYIDHVNLLAQYYIDNMAELQVNGNRVLSLATFEIDRRYNESPDTCDYLILCNRYPYLTGDQIQDFC